MLNLVVLGSTNGTDLVPIVRTIQNKKLKATISMVISDKSTAGILEKAKQHNLPHQFIGALGKKREEYDRELIALIKPLNPDVIVLIGYMRILSSVFISEFRNKIINVHPSLLPKFAGGMDVNVHKAVIESGVRTSGCTVHLVDESVDGGAILCQKQVDVSPGETEYSLKEKVQKKEGEAFIEVLSKWSVSPPKIENNVITGW